jgi:hypothetical protein
MSEKQSLVPEVKENKSLIALSAEVEEDLITSGGEITEMIATKLAQISRKVDGSVFVLERFEKIEEHYKEKADKLLSIAHAAKVARERLKDYIKTAMEIQGVIDLEGDDFRFRITKAPPAVEILDQSKLPDEYIVTKTTKAIDNKKIKAAIESGQKVPGADLRYSVGLRVYPRKP